MTKNKRVLRLAERLAKTKVLFALMLLWLIGIPTLFIIDTMVRNGHVIAWPMIQTTTQNSQINAALTDADR